MPFWGPISFKLHPFSLLIPEFHFWIRLVKRFVYSPRQPVRVRQWSKRVSPSKVMKAASSSLMARRGHQTAVGFLTYLGSSRLYLSVRTRVRTWIQSTGGGSGGGGGGHGHAHVNKSRMSLQTLQPAWALSAAAPQVQIRRRRVQIDGDASTQTQTPIVSLCAATRLRSKMYFIYGLK